MVQFQSDDISKQWHVHTLEHTCMILCPYHCILFSLRAYSTAQNLAPASPRRKSALLHDSAHSGYLYSSSDQCGSCVGVVGAALQTASSNWPLYSQCEWVVRLYGQVSTSQSLMSSPWRPCTLGFYTRIHQQPSHSMDSYKGWTWFRVAVNYL